MTAEELEKWKRLRGQEPPPPPPPDPRVILFAAQKKRVDRFDDEDDACQGCIFNGQHSSVCNVAGEQAAARGLPDCEDVGDGFIYVPVKVDPRQLDLLKDGNHDDETAARP